MSDGFNASRASDPPGAIHVIDDSGPASKVRLATEVLEWREDTPPPYTWAMLIAGMLSDRKRTRTPPANRPIDGPATMIGVREPKGNQAGTSSQATNELANDPIKRANGAMSLKVQLIIIMYSDAQRKALGRVRVLLGLSVDGGPILGFRRSAKSVARTRIVKALTA